MRTVPCVIDIEASGFGRGSFPIEAGVAPPDGDAICTLVRAPRTGRMGRCGRLD